VQEISRAAILKLLDVGAMGIIVPCVNSVADAEKIAEVGKYMPVGQRGVANTAGSGFWFEDYATHGLRIFRDVEQGIHAHPPV
jgi:4-hydroxy-2-oxoheptanedioate aldolase